MLENPFLAMYFFVTVADYRACFIPAVKYHHKMLNQTLFELVVGLSLFETCTVHKCHQVLADVRDCTIMHS